MSFETFRVELRGGSATFARVDAAIRQLPHALNDHSALARSASFEVSQRAYSR